MRGACAFLGFVTLLACTVPAAGAHANWVASPIALGGDLAPGTGDTHLLFRSWPQVDDAGDIVYTSFLTAGGRAVHRWSNGAVTKVAATGDPAPGVAPVWDTVDAVSGNAAGDLVLFGRPLGFLSEIVSVVERNGTATLLSQQSEVPAPGSSGYEHVGWGSRPHAVEAAIDGLLLSNSAPGVFVARDGVDTTIAVEGTSGPAGTYGLLGKPDMNASGTVVFPDREFHAAAGVYVASGGSVTRVVAEGDATPGTIGQTFAGFSWTEIADTGRIVFTATLDSIGGDRGLFAYASGTVTAIALEGDVAPRTSGATSRRSGAGNRRGHVRRHRGCVAERARRDRLRSGRRGRLDDFRRLPGDAGTARPGIVDGRATRAGPRAGRRRPDSNAEADGLRDALAERATAAMDAER